MSGSRVLRWIPVVVLVVGLSGCGGGSHDRYLPAKTTAREAVTKALEAWKAGAAYGPISDSKPKINVFEARWRDGKKLESFEIVEDIPKVEPPQFKVRIQVAGEPEQVDTYLVIGIEPLNVFRDVDYKQTESM